MTSVFSIYIHCMTITYCRIQFKIYYFLHEWNFFCMHQLILHFTAHWEILLFFFNFSNGWNFMICDDTLSFNTFICVFLFLANWSHNICYCDECCVALVNIMADICCSCLILVINICAVLPTISRHQKCIPKFKCFLLMMK